MKQLVIIFSLIIGSAAHAEYKVGDFATYAVNTNGQNLDIKEEVLGVDLDNDALSIKESIMIGGTTVQETTEDGSISENEQNEQFFDACLQLPATLNPRYESITVPAGTFNVCHLTSTDDTGAIINGYFAKVVFGIVKMTKENSSDGSDMNMELKEFKKNLN